jgi:cytidylate kinase
MSIVTISRGTYTRGKEIAEKLATKLGYECLSREVLLEASEQFNIPEIKLVRAIHNAPSILERFTYGKQRYVSYVRAALLKHVQRDNIVYHGLAGHFLLLGIPHVLKVRVINDMDARVQEEMRRENISAAEARKILEKDDLERQKWSLQIFGVDTKDSMLYDLVLNLRSMSVDDAVAIISCTLQRPCFHTTSESRRLLDDSALAARIQSALVEDIPSAKVTCKEGEIFVEAKGSASEEKELTSQINRIIRQVAGIDLKVHYAFKEQMPY